MQLCHTDFDFLESSEINQENELAQSNWVTYYYTNSGAHLNIYSIHAPINWKWNIIPIFCEKILLIRSHCHPRYPSFLILKITQETKIIL